LAGRGDGVRCGRGVGCRWAPAYAVAVPQYQAMTAAFVELQAAAAAFCASPDAPGLEATRGAWRRAMESWVTASTIELGPIGDDNRDLRVAFWPDANSNVERAVAQQLLRDDELTAATLAQQSVARQGLPAFERLLFEPDTDVLAAFTTGDRAARRRTYAQAIAGNLVAIARAVEDGWTAENGYAHQLAFAGRSSDVFATREAAIDDVVNGLVTALSITRDGRIADPLGGGPRRRRDLRRGRRVRLRGLPAQQRPRRARGGDRRRAARSAGANRCDSGSARRRGRRRGVPAGGRRAARSRDRAHAPDRVGALGGDGRHHRLQRERRRLTPCERSSMPARRGDRSCSPAAPVCSRRCRW
jgi:hypothetical protein